MSSSNSHGTPEPVENPVFAAQNALDSSGEESVNQEDINGGTDPMTSTLALDSPAETRPVITSTEGLEYLFAPPKKTVDEVELTTLGQAVLYLRVSTPRQLHTAADLDEDGNSIATQRVEALRKTRELRATVSREFVEPGHSAQTINKRPEFKKLLRYLDDHPEVKYVVIYMRSRVFRNFTDAAITKRQLLEKGVRLISAKEEFGEGYMADAMEAITDVMNEVQVRMNGEDVRVKMAHKVEQGGSVGRAKLGYCNVRKDYSGRLVNTIDIDPERAPLVTWAFEQYATGQYSITQLRGLMEEQGLTTRASPSRPERPVSNSRLAGILRDPYYTGVIRYKGKLYGGRHQPLISKETFLKVQEILDQRKRQGDRDIIHFHYLKGIIYCGECYKVGRRSRLLYTQAKGNGGTYEYFICTAKQRGLCSMPAIRVEQMEAKVARTVAGERITPEAIEGMRALIAEVIDDLLTADREAKTQLRKQLQKLEAQEERLIELAANGTVTVSKLQAKLEKTTLQKAAIEEQLNLTEERLKYGAEKALAYIGLLREPWKLYQNAGDPVRRDLLSAFFTKILVHKKAEQITLTSERNQTNQAIRELHGYYLEAKTEPTTTNAKIPRSNTTKDSKTANSGSGSFVHGLSKTHVAGVPGLEPRTSEPESLCALSLYAGNPLKHWDVDCGDSLEIGGFGIDKVQDKVQRSRSPHPASCSPTGRYPPRMCEHFFPEWIGEAEWDVWWCPECPAVCADPLEVAPDVVHMYRDGARIALQLLGGVIHCDGHPDIWTAARIGQAMLIIGLDAWTGRERELDSYLRRGSRLRLGLIRILPGINLRST